jgi:hypothetical protein
LEVRFNCINPKNCCVNISITVKHCLDFSFVFFSFPFLPEETCFQQAGYCAVEGTSQAVLGSSDQRKVPTSLSLFLKSEKIPALLYIGKGPEYMPFRDFRPVPLAYRPLGTDLQ